MTGKEKSSIGRDLIIGSQLRDSGGNDKNNRETENLSGSNLKDVTWNFNNKCILIYSLAAKKFASARLDVENYPICCSTMNQDSWERFQVTIDNEGWASFKATNGLYLTVRLDVQSDLPPIRATAPRSLLWEQFKIYEIGNAYGIMARCNGMWITSRIDWSDNPLYASCAKADLWETFDIKTV